MKYTIEITDILGQELTTETDSEKEAIEIANEEAADETNETVYIFTYRKSDGQTIYLNRDGYSPIGINWR